MSFDAFKLNFLKVNNNILKSRIFRNPVLDSLNRGRLYMDNIFESELGQRAPVPARAAVPVPVPAPLSCALFEDVLTDGILVPKRYIEQKWNIKIHNETYQKIKRTVTVLKAAKIITTNPSFKRKTIENLLLGFKKG
jgi:hypothetical protein